MADLSKNSSVIQLKDPYLPEFMDFEALRKEGLTHIGNLSGRIWTDHNVHDPGVTILEVLVYALMDLGYKTNLPFTDLITLQNGEEDNFLTPLDILTINPVTITDYRKLLLEIKGVRNAWLESMEEEIPLFINQNTNELTCTTSHPDLPDSRSTTEPNADGSESAIISAPDSERCFVGSTEYLQLHLNGLYKVYIEKDTDIIKTEGEQADLIEEVKQLLHDHRNLCEDFADICILAPLEIGVCVEVEIVEGFEATKIYKEIFRKIKDFIQPELKYYTLNELLDKGRTIDTIFSGRPYRKESFGFVDTEELNRLERRTQINLSDLYHEILSIEGVRKIKKAQINGGAIINKFSEEWVEGNKIGTNEVPVFSFENTCIDLYRADGTITLDKSKIHQTFTFAKKFGLPLRNLDCEVPSGVFPEDLSEYYSIQNDFPVVYGIGEDGLPESATLERRTKALQLKGYLTFYDQLLANYTSQLANIRSLFSLVPEDEKSPTQKQTYFTQIAESIPGLDTLLRFYDESENIPKGSLLALPIANSKATQKALDDLNSTSRPEFTVKNYCKDNDALVPLFSFSAAAHRAISINQLIDSLFNEEYSISIYSDKFGYFFVINPELPNDILLVGTKRYSNSAEATNEAKNLAFIASRIESYHLVTDTSETTEPDEHYFDISYQPISYLKLIQDLTEDKTEYHTRRKQFLNHLLARFGEEFTAYTMLQYQSKIGRSDQALQTLNDQSSYINEFAEISRNRGKAFNYLEPSWNSNNISGFEKRVSLLAGLNNYSRRNLCNFEVTQCFRLILKDPNGTILFRSNRSYETIENLQKSARNVLKQLREPKTYKRLGKNLNGFDAQAMNRIFSEKPNPENIIDTEHIYIHRLSDAGNKTVVVGDNMNMRSAKVATSKEKEFIEKINYQTHVASQKETKNYRLLALDGKNRFLNVNAFDSEIKTLKSYKWHLTNGAVKEKVSSDAVFIESEDAWKDMLTNAKPESYISKHEVGLSWLLQINKNISFKGLSMYPDAYKAVAAWRQAKMLGNSTKNFQIKENKNTFSLELKNEKGSVIARSNEIAKKPFETSKTIEDCIVVFSNRKAKPKYPKEKDKYGFVIPKKDKTIVLKSYCVFDSEKEALQEMGKTFEFGKDKKNYLQSGDQGNPEYNFILKDKTDTFIALPPEHFETTSDRNKALTSIVKFYKSNSLPIYVKEEPRRFVWSLYDKNKSILESKTEFSTKKKAQANFDKEIVTEAKKGNREFYDAHISKIETLVVPVKYRFIYGDSSSQNEIEPLFISNESFKTYKEAQEGYTDFIQSLTSLSFKGAPKNEKKYDFALFKTKSKRPVAVQYRMDSIYASKERAKTLTTYVNTIYTQSGTPREQFVTSEMTENKNGSYEWRFYKKNAPIAVSPFCCTDIESSEELKSNICEIIPPIDLNQCPPKKVVFRPDKNKEEYRFRVCFNDNENNEFLLISYKAYDSFEKATAAWEEQWLEIIEIARNQRQYGEDGRISKEEIYDDPKSKECKENSFIAVIPKSSSNKIIASGGDLVEFYTELANMYPIYKVTDEKDEACNTKYKFRVIIREGNVKETNCKPLQQNEVGDLLWTSTTCFDDLCDAIDAYNHFYTIAGSSNNCRILCENGCYYIGLVEVLLESSCEYESEALAWDEIVGEDHLDSCCDCIPGGVREFVYASDDIKNYVTLCEENYWKFKVVSPKYYVAQHNCWYNSEKERDEQIDKWIKNLSTLNWSSYIPKTSVKNNIKEVNTTENPAGVNIQSFLSIFCERDDICEIIEKVRECLALCDSNENELDDLQKTETDSRATLLIECLREKFKNDEKILNEIDKQEFKADDLIKQVNHYPIYKTSKGYCFRLYWPKNDNEVNKDGLQPCGCDKDEINDSNPCKEAFTFLSSNCYSCCAEAIDAFNEFCKLVQEKTYTIECLSKAEYGPYSFEIIDKRKELAFHPQQYESYQEVLDAIEMTRNCANDTGMHLLEHILLRPMEDNDCRKFFIGDESNDQKQLCCLLPVCPDYCCEIDWKPDMDRDDPCADNVSKIINYLPGSDPYSFWATLVLPAWSKRFRTLEARQAFEKLVYQEVPALVGLNILWLSPHDLCKFEDAYRKWLEWKQDPENSCERDDIPPNCHISDCIRNLTSEEPCPTLPGAQRECDCADSERPVDDFCCLPPPVEGTLFWGHCPPESGDDIQDETRWEFLANVNLEAASVVSTSESTAKRKPIAETSSSEVKKTTKSDLKKVRQRKPKYLANVKASADENMMNTKSYERAVFFLQNTPTVGAFEKLVSYFNRYSLKEGNNVEGFMNLLKNAAWHLLDGLALDSSKIIKKQELNDVKKSLKILKDHNLSISDLKADWNDKELKSLVNKERLSQLKGILK